MPTPLVDKGKATPPEGMGSPALRSADVVLGRSVIRWDIAATRLERTTGTLKAPPVLSLRMSTSRCRGISADMRPRCDALKSSGVMAASSANLSSSWTRVSYSSMTRGTCPAIARSRPFACAALRRPFPQIRDHVVQLLDHLVTGADYVLVALFTVGPQTIAVPLLVLCGPLLFGLSESLLRAPSNLRSHVGLTDVLPPVRQPGGMSETHR